MVQCALQLQRRGPIVDSIVFCQEEGIYSVDIPKGLWQNLNHRSLIVLCLSAKRGRLWRRRKREAVRLMVKGSVICRVSGGVAVAACGAGAYFSKGEPR